MIKASHNGNPSLGIRPFMVVLQSDRLSIDTLPDALPFQTMEVEDWEGVFKKLSSFRPGCLLVDFDADRDQLLSQIRGFADQGIRYSIVGVTADRSRRTLHQALRHGFIDLVPHPLDSRLLIEAVEDAFHADGTGKDSLCNLRSGFGRLTPKEREVLPQLLLGVTSRRLAGELNVSYQTIDRHKKRVIEKMNVSNMTELAMKLFRQY
ncbi:Transcriptional regulatory protein FixJ [Stieleria maiorica]|uniref:Transcriptional regulatory protein FixJ n=1 Tax=Stieleria maiorica TaxID=2795974 RepID=A0A5B9MGN4_9BACT|nr:LuxR C-terminal-related transcriptional regulator [Stieleria maiorica]QEG00034.1 Transcriptional regulatory protein FixJ [Stieleria maiorica]